MFLAWRVDKVIIVDVRGGLVAGGCDLGKD
jgi:hypothetical protein